MAEWSKAIACWDCGFESRQWHEYLSVVNVVCCQVQVSAAGHHSSRGVLPALGCHCVSSRNVKNEAALVRVGQLPRGLGKAKTSFLLNSKPCPEGIWESEGTVPSIRNHGEWSERFGEKKTLPSLVGIHHQFYFFILPPPASHYIQFSFTYFKRHLAQSLQYHLQDRNPHAFQACALFVFLQGHNCIQSHCSH